MPLLSLAERCHPATDLAGHLMWTRDGCVWATWRLTGLSYGGTIADKRSVRDLHRLLVRALCGEALMLSSVVPEDPVSVVARMIEGLNLVTVPDWVAECEATLDTLAEVAMGERYYWLAVPLSNHGKRRFLEPGRSAWRGLQDRLDLPVHRPVNGQLGQRLLQAQQLEDLIPALFRPTKTTVAEQVWIANHAQRRGLLDLPVPEPGGPAEELLTPSSAAVLAEPILDEGARTDHEPAGRVNIMAQRVLKVIDVRGGDIHDLPPTYQCLMAVADVPAGGMTFPGSEWLFHLDQSGMDVDWAIRLRINSREKVLARNRKAVKALNEQFEQREAEVTTGLHDLDLAAELLGEYQAVFANDKLEVEVEHTTILAVGAGRGHDGQSDAEVNAAAQDQAAALTKSLYDWAGIKLERIPGHQQELWWAMHPGAPRTSLVRTYAQFTSSAHFAKLVPFIGARLGGRKGAAFGLNLATSRPQVVHIDLGGYPELDMSGSILFVGEMGGGKSVGQKKCCSDLVDQGGQFFAIDKSEDGEWAVFAASFGSHLVLDPMSPAWSMDPLRILPLALGADVARTFLVQLLNIDTSSDLGILLSHVVHPDYLTGHAIASLGALTEHLRAGQCPIEGSPDLGRRMQNWSTTPVARVIFDAGLPVADLSVSATAWRTHGMEQPTNAEMASAHLFRQMPLEKIFGRAYYRLLCSLARRLCFADRSRPAAFVVDEMYDATQNRENVDDMQHFLRRGRRPKALLIGGTHDVNDLDDDVLAGLIPTRVLMRHRDEQLASNGIHWLGIRGDDPQFDGYLTKVTEDLSPVLGDAGVPPERRGEAIIRDAFGNIGTLRILPPARPGRRQAVLTTPPKSASRR